MTSNDFFVLVHRLDGDAVTEYVLDRPANMGEAPTCEVCGLFLGTLAWLPPYRVEIESFGNEFGDLAFGFGAREFLVSPRFRQIYDNNGLQGLSGFEPIEVVKVIRHKNLTCEPPRYLKASVCRGETAVDPVASGVEWQGEVGCPRCLQGRKLKRRRRIVIDENTWSGEDIFLARGLPSEFIASRRFKEVCEVNQVTNAVFVPSIHRR